MKLLISILFAFSTIIGLGMTADSVLAADPCSANPCSAKAKMTKRSRPIRRVKMLDEIVVKNYSDKLWVDPKLGKSGLSCGSCHPNGKGLRRGSWPKYIAMADDILTLDQMINFCMTNPMKAKPIKWYLQKMTGLAYYVSTNSNEPEVGEAVNPCAANPCAAKPPAVNPCAAKPPAVNPCATNPCAAKPPATNPCATNPCATNPCAAKPPAVNPCAVNPCAVNPCAVNPCAVNPCALNPCAAKPPVTEPPAVNPCATNPCTVNPCAPKPSATEPPVVNPCAGFTIPLAPIR